MTEERPQLLMPRSLLFLAGLWLIGSWFIAFGVRPPVHPSAASFEPGVRLILLCLTTGLIIGWPLLRLSQIPTPYPIRVTLLDLFVLISLIQIVVWLLRLVTTWSVIRTAAIDAAITGWLLLASATVAAVIGTPKRGPRNLAMAACLAMCLLGPALAVTGVMGSVQSLALVDLSPLLAIRSLGDAGAAPVADHQWRWIALLYLAAMTAWLALGVWVGARGGPATSEGD